MKDPSPPVRGYYSILQFVPDLERSEGANIGVVLFCPERHFLKAQTATGNDRVWRFFGPGHDVDLDLDRVNAFKATFEERVAAEASRIHTPDEFQQFIDTRANQLLLSQPVRSKCSTRTRSWRGCLRPSWAVAGARRSKTERQCRQIVDWKKPLLTCCGEANNYLMPVGAIVS
jgi:hypothetical protein